MMNFIEITKHVSVEIDAEQTNSAEDDQKQKEPERRKPQKQDVRR